MLLLSITFVDCACHKEGINMNMSLKAIRKILVSKETRLMKAKKRKTFTDLYLVCMHGKMYEVAVIVGVHVDKFSLCNKEGNLLIH